MKERRSSKRISINRNIKVDLEGTLIPATVVNLSLTGALFTLAESDSHALAKADLGREISFKIKPKNLPARKYTGELLRIYYEGEVLYFALRFWKKYVEIS